MSEIGPHNHLVDVTGIAVGHAQDARLISGVTVVRFDVPTTASVSVLGGAPAGRDMECLAPDAFVDTVDAIVLSGGSGFGLDAASGAQAWLRENHRGLEVGTTRVPIVPQAICFDLLNGGDKDWGRYPPYRELAFDACGNASTIPSRLGSMGAGLGATTVSFKGGVGAASAQTSFGATVAALMVVNALGSATVGAGPHFWAAPFEVDGEFGGRGSLASIPDDARQPRYKGGVISQPATTIGVIATDAVLTKAQAHRLATAAHDGYARALRLTHALLDGDMLFAASTRAVPLSDPVNNQIELGALAADCVARAIARGVYEASDPGNGYIGPPAYRDVHPG